MRSHSSLQKLRVRNPDESSHVDELRIRTSSNHAVFAGHGPPLHSFSHRAKHTIWSATCVPCWLHRGLGGGLKCQCSGYRCSRCPLRDYFKTIRRSCTAVTTCGLDSVDTKNTPKQKQTIKTTICWFDLVLMLVLLLSSR